MKTKGPVNKGKYKYKIGKKSSQLKESKIEENKVNKDVTIIYPPTVDWYMMYQRPQQLLTALSKIQGYRSIFITNEAFKKLENPITELNSDLFVVSAEADYSHLIKGKKVLWFNYPPNYKYVSKLNTDLAIFDAIDNPIEEFGFWQREMEDAIRASDIISCTAELLYKQHVNRGKPVFMCPNGADFQHFHRAKDKMEKPHDFPQTFEGEAVIGFYGAMATWVDYELIKKIADRYLVVLIGKNKYYNNEVKHPNIITIDHKNYSELPNYLSWFDLSLVPFKLTEMIKGCDPIKYYEYMSAGKPVLSTEIEELKRRYKKQTYFINHDNYLKVIDKAIKENNPEKVEERIQIARENSWEARAKKISEVINKFI